MKILLINQPYNDRGDESAHRALVRTMLKNIPNVQIKVPFNFLSKASLNEMREVSPQIEYINIPRWCFLKGYYKVVKLSMYLNIHHLLMIFPSYWKIRKLYKWADLVVCAPGGICMGLYQNWNHLTYLYYALFLKKELAYYGRSIGPFPTETFSNRLFRKMSIKMLEHFIFTSLRDDRSMKIAHELGFFKVTSVVDTDFLDSPQVQIPNEVKTQLGHKSYFTFVPNLLIWHPAFQNLSRELLIDFYSEMLDVLFRVFPESNAVLLPQIYCSREDRNDYSFFVEIAQRSGDERIIVVSDKYGCDIQQAIIAKSLLMVGARYHSIVYAINQGVPFVSLSYEHKMSGMLDTLGKSEYTVSIEHVLDTEEGRSTVIKQLEEKARMASPDIVVREKAKQIAMNGFEEFMRRCIK